LKNTNYKAGIESYYSGSQFLHDGFRTKPFAEIRLFAEKTFGRFPLFINAENLTGVRQSHFGQVIFPPYQSPPFSEI
jgi:iron complex outermembrane receptor protein